MPIDPDAPITITAYDWVPDFSRGQVRDLRVRWALEEVGQDYAVRLLPQDGQKDAAHRALQPFGQVPTYEEGELTLFESGAIVWHIAERFPGLLPEDPAGRARSLEWLFAALNTVEPPISDYAIAVGRLHTGLRGQGVSLCFRPRDPDPGQKERHYRNARPARRDLRAHRKAKRTTECLGLPPVR